MDDSSTKESLIFHKIMIQDLQGLKQLINEKINVNQIKKNELNEGEYSTPLLYAIQRKWIKGVQLLLQAGADVHLCLDWEPRPLGLAVEQGDLEIVKLLLQAGANPSHGGVDNFPLHHAICLKRADIVKALIEAGVEINGRNYSDLTPLMVAAQNGNLALVRVLIEAGACINLVDNDYGETALDKAASNEHQEVVDYLYPFTNPKLNYCQLETEGPKFSEKFNNNIQAIPILIEVLENDNFYHQFSDSRVFAARALGQLKDKRAIFPLIEVLKNENPEVQNTAIWALGEIGAPQAIKPLVELLSSEEELVRDSAKDVLRKLIVQFPEFKNEISF